MRLLANGEEVMLAAESPGPPRRKYWVYTEWADGLVVVDGVECRGKNAHMHWRLAIDVEVAGDWSADHGSGAMQDTFEHMLFTLEDAGVPKGLRWVEEKSGVVVDIYSEKFELAPNVWRIQRS